MNRLTFLCLIGIPFSCAAGTAKNTLIIASDQDWRSIFTDSAQVDFDVDQETAGGVKGTLHYKRDTFVQIPYAQSDSKVIPKPSSSLWGSLKNVMTLKLGYKPAETEWRLLAAPEYEKIGGKAGSDGFVVSWPFQEPYFVFPKFVTPFPGKVDLFVYAVFEHDGYIIPFCVYGNAPGGKRSLFLFDNLDSNQIFYSCFTCYFRLASSGFRLTEYGGPFPSPQAEAKGSILDAVNGSNSTLVDIWMDPVLDKYLPRLSAHPARKGRKKERH